MNVTHLHTSGAANMPWRAWREDILRLIENTGATVVTGTEARNREAALELEGWNSRSRGDAIIAWNTDTWRVEYTKSTMLSEDTGYFRPYTVVYAVLVHRESKQRWLFACHHTPVTKDGARDLSDGKAAYKQGMRLMRKDITKLTDLFQIDAVVVSADWNLSMTSAIVRARMLSWFPTLKVAVPRDYKGPGTGGARVSVIDGALVSRNVKVHYWKVLGKIGSSDHSPVVQKLSVRDRRRQGWRKYV